MRLESKFLLEEQIIKDISILSDHWLLIGRQAYTDFGVAEVLGHPVVAGELISGDKPMQRQYYMAADCGEDEAEYFVLVNWLHKVPASNAINKFGFFGNQNSVARPRTPKCEHTVVRLKELWNIC